MTLPVIFIGKVFKFSRCFGASLDFFELIIHGLCNGFIALMKNESCVYNISQVTIFIKLINIIVIAKQYEYSISFRSAPQNNIYQFNQILTTHLISRYTKFTLNE